MLLALVVLLGSSEIGDLRPSLLSSLFVSLSTENRISVLRVVTFQGKLVVRREAAVFDNSLLWGI